MGFFTVGNLITLGIVALALILYRQLDRNNRTLDKLRKYADKLKDELASFAAEKGTAVKNFGIDLEVEQKSARELMKRLQALTEEELAKKAQAIAKIDEKITAYGSSLAELDKMTARVQENLNRIRDESAFVENTGKRVGEVKDKLAEIEKDLGGLKIRFERENAESLENASEAVIAAVKSTVSDLGAQAETIERQVEDHRAAVNKIEQTRAASLARDMDIINKTLKEAVERAGNRADKMEEAALVKLRDQAQDRVNRLQAAWEDKLKASQETVKTRLQNIQDLLKASRDEYKTEHSEIEARQKQYRDEWKKDVQELSSLAKKQSEEWAGLSRETEQKILEAGSARLEEYQQAQAEQFKQLDTLANDALALDGELRLSMQETVNRVNADFTRFADESGRARESVSAEFGARVKALKAEMDGVEQGLSALKNQAYENVSEKLKLFEDDFFTDLGKRSSEIDRRIAEWHDSLEARLTELAEEGRTERQKAETGFNEDLKQNLAEQGDKLITELERLKTEASAFEEGIRDEMRAADESRVSFQEQLDRDLEEARSAAETSVKAEIGKYKVSMSETLKKNQRDLEEQLRENTAVIESKNSELHTMMETTRRNVDDWQGASAAQIRDLDASMEEARRRIRELAMENDERTAQIRTAVDDLKRDLSAQTKLFDKADELKLELERRIEDLSGDLDRLEQQKNEAAQLENQFVRIKRLEDDVNAKMTRFLSEKHRIEVMEADFNRLLQTSAAVEEKLVQVSSSDDVLQGIQLQIRRLDDAIGETEEKYQRIERKNQVLEETNDSIAHNFKALQESEKIAGKLSDDVSRISGETESLRISIESLADESEKARETAEKLSTLDESLSYIEKRIREMQVAREWLAGAESRMVELDKQIQDQLRLTGSVLKREGGKTPPRATGKDDHALPPGDRENIIKLRRQGWTVDELAKTFNISKGEVELILEVAPKD
ncbi:MAG: hypothetical protein LBN21_10360 [Treponema sp.]|nr:hypothetical protein [Treponema sp.]